MAETTAFATHARLVDHAGLAPLLQERIVGARSSRRVPFKTAGRSTALAAYPAVKRSQQTLIGSPAPKAKPLARGRDHPSLTVGTRASGVGSLT